MSINPAYSALKFLDQPALLHRLEKYMPVALPAAGAAYVAYDALRTPEDKRLERIKKTGSVMAFTIGSAFMGRVVAEKAGDKITQLILRNRAAVSHAEHEAEHDAVAAANTVLNRLKEKSGSIPESLKAMVEKTKEKVLLPQDVHRLRKEMQAFAGEKEGRELVNELIPLPKELKAAEILGEIGNLSLLGLFPVLGGIAGGVVGNVLNKENWKDKLKDQSKEGFYQYFANIFLCNIGAVGMLGLVETLQKTSPAIAKSVEKYGRAWRLGAMSLGILGAGVLGGSAIANFMGNNFINPLFDKGPKGAMEHFNEKMKTGGVKALFKDLNKERHPEAMDVGLHVDDFATVGALAGLGWVEPVLLALYTLSGFRAGMGYRNGHGHKASQAPSSAESQTVQPVAAQVTAAQQPVTPQPAMQHSSLMPHPLGHPSVALQPAPHQPVAYASITMQPVPLHARPQSPFALMGSGYPAESAAVS